MCNFSETTSVGEKNKRRKRLAKKKRSPIFFCWHAAWVCPCTAGHQGQGMQMRLCGRLSCKTCASWPLAIHPIWFCQDLDKKMDSRYFSTVPGFFRLKHLIISLVINQVTCYKIKYKCCHWLKDSLQSQYCNKFQPMRGIKKVTWFITRLIMN